MYVDLKTIMNATPVVRGTTIYSDPFWVLHMYGFSMQVSFSGSVYGTGSVEVSNDGDMRTGGNPGAAVNWTPDTASPTTVQTVSASIAGSDSTIFYQRNTQASLVRFKFACSTDVNNAGSVTVKAACKGPSQH